MRYQHKELIFLFAGIGILVILYVLYKIWKVRVTKRMGDPKLIELLSPNYSRIKTTAKFIVILFALSFGIVAAINPRKAGAQAAVTRQGIDVVIALDVSRSMLATDLAPNRLDRARAFIQRLVNEMPNDRFALVLFAGKSFLQMPMTADHGALQLYLASATPDAIPTQGTVISDALEMSARAFTDEEQRFKTIVLISDGEDHEDAAVDKAKELAEQGVLINTIGIGSLEGSMIPDPETGDVKKDDVGNTVITRLNEDILRDISNAANGVYSHLESGDVSVALLKTQFDQIDKKSFTDISQVNFKNYYTWFALAMFILLLIEIPLPETKKVAA